MITYFFLFFRGQNFRYRRENFCGESLAVNYYVCLKNKFKIFRNVSHSKSEEQEIWNSCLIFPKQWVLKIESKFSEHRTRKWRNLLNLLKLKRSNPKDLKTTFRFPIILQSNSKLLHHEQYEWKTERKLAENVHYENDFKIESKFFQVNNVQKIPTFKNFFKTWNYFKRILYSIVMNFCFWKIWKSSHILGI